MHEVELPHEILARLDAMERDRDELRVEWADTLGKVARLTTKLAAQHRRELDRATREDEGDPQLSLRPPGTAVPAPVDRAVQRAQLRARLNSTARNMGAVLVLLASTWLLAQIQHGAQQLAFLPILVGGLKALGASGIAKRVLQGGAQALGGLVRGRAGQAVTAAAKAVGSKTGRRILKGAVSVGGAAVGGAVFEAGGRVVRQAPTGGAVFHPQGGGGGRGVMMHEIAPGVESDGHGRMYVRGDNGRRRRVSGWDALGNPVFAKPRVNVLNPKALTRANRRVVGFATVAQRVLKHLAQQSRKFAPPSQRGGRRRGGHKQGCKCVACRAA